MIFVYLFTGALSLVALLVQAHPSFSAISIGGVKPDLLFIIIVYLSYCFGSFYGEVVGFITGLLQDSISNSPLGLLTFPKVAIGFIVGMFGRSIFKSNVLTICLLLFAASIVKGVMTLLLCVIFEPSLASAYPIISVIIPEAFYNAVLGPPLFLLFDKIFEKELKREGYL